MNLRDALCCRGCGRKPHARETYHRGLEYHHVVPVREGGNGQAENIVLLCRKCHRLADAGDLRPDPAMLAVPDAISCSACGAAFDPRTVEMNCGHYRCPACETETHLFDHFGYGREPATP